VISREKAPRPSQLPTGRLEMEASLVTTITKPRWTARDSVCLGLAAVVVLNVIMCLWVAATSMSTARRQATAVFYAIKNAPAIEFNLSLKTNSSSEPLNVTGRLRPRLSECSRRVHFDGRMVVTTPTSSEEFVLANHRGYRRPLSTGSWNATCLTTQDIPPLHTLVGTVHSAFRPSGYEAFDVDCKPLQFRFYDEDFVVCAEDWLRARLHAQNNVTPIATTGSGDQQQTVPWLVVHGKQSAFGLNVLSSSDATIETGQPFAGLDRCEFLEAPMTSRESCSMRITHCPNPHVDTCKKHLQKQEA
jgi:hypothetical protein